MNFSFQKWFSRGSHQPFEVLMKAYAKKADLTAAEDVLSEMRANAVAWPDMGTHAEAEGWLIMGHSYEYLLMYTYI